MWIKKDAKGKEQVWYEGELIDKIHDIALTACLTCCECKEGDIVEQCGYSDILDLINNEKEGK